MSLDYRLTAINNWEATCLTLDEHGHRKLRTVTEVLVWSTMLVGIGRITEKNAEDFAARLTFAHRLGAAPTIVEADAEARIPTLAEVRAHIGLTTNVSTETAAHFRKRLTDYAWGDAQRAVDKQRVKLAHVASTSKPEVTA